MDGLKSPPRADCLYTGISSGPNALKRVWETLPFLIQSSLLPFIPVCCAPGVRGELTCCRWFGARNVRSPSRRQFFAPPLKPVTPKMFSKLLGMFLCIKLEFHDADTDTDILARMSVSVSVSASWNASLIKQLYGYMLVISYNIYVFITRHFNCFAMSRRVRSEEKLSTHLHIWASSYHIKIKVDCSPSEPGELSQ